MALTEDHTSGIELICMHKTQYACFLNFYRESRVKNEPRGSKMRQGEEKRGQIRK